jgi:hypothetical protein
MQKFLKFILGMKLYMFQTVPLSIIRSYSPCTQQWCMSYRFVDSCRAESVWNPDPARELSTGWHSDPARDLSTGWHCDPARELSTGWHCDPARELSTGWHCDPARELSTNQYDIQHCFTADDGERNCLKHVEFHSKNKSENLVHLVGFNIQICHDARSHERQISEEYE